MVVHSSSSTSGVSASSGRSSTRLTRFWTSWIFRGKSSMPTSNWIWICEKPSEETDLMSSTPSMPATSSSMGIVMSLSISSGETPG